MSSPGKILSRPGSRQVSRQGSLQENDVENHQPLAGSANISPHNEEEILLSPFPGPLPLPLPLPSIASVQPLETTTNPSVDAVTTNTTKEKRSKKKKKTKEEEDMPKEVDRKAIRLLKTSQKSSNKNDASEPSQKQFGTEAPPTSVLAPVEEKKKDSGSMTPFLSLFGKKETKATTATKTKAVSTPHLPPIVPKK